MPGVSGGSIGDIVKTDVYAHDITFVTADMWAQRFSELETIEGSLIVKGIVDATCVRVPSVMDPLCKTFPPSPTRKIPLVRASGLVCHGLALAPPWSSGVPRRAAWRS